LRHADRGARGVAAATGSSVAPQPGKRRKAERGGGRASARSGSRATIRWYTEDDVALVRAGAVALQVLGGGYQGCRLPSGIKKKHEEEYLKAPHDKENHHYSVKLALQMQIVLGSSRLRTCNLGALIQRLSGVYKNFTDTPGIYSGVEFADLRAQLRELDKFVRDPHMRVLGDPAGSPPDEAAHKAAQQLLNVSRRAAPVPPSARRLPVLPSTASSHSSALGDDDSMSFSSDSDDSADSGFGSDSDAGPEAAGDRTRGNINAGADAYKLRRIFRKQAAAVAAAGAEAATAAAAAALAVARELPAAAGAGGRLQFVAARRGKGGAGGAAAGAELAASYSMPRARQSVHQQAKKLAKVSELHHLQIASLKTGRELVVAANAAAQGVLDAQKDKQLSQAVADYIAASSLPPRVTPDDIAAHSAVVAALSARVVLLTSQVQKAQPLPQPVSSSSPSASAPAAPVETQTQTELQHLPLPPALPAPEAAAAASSGARRKRKRAASPTSSPSPRAAPSPRASPIALCLSPRSRARELARQRRKQRAAAAAATTSSAPAAAPAPAKPPGRGRVPKKEKK
jgi:hypothetical protein